MRILNRDSVPIWAAAVGVFVAVASWQHVARLSLAEVQFASGYVLISIIVFLALYSGRKRLSMVPVGRASIWLTLHVVAGVLALALFWLHAGRAWPTGAADQALVALFYAVCLSGVVGYGLQLWLPGRLSRAGREIIYERTAAEIAEIRAEAEKTVLAAAADSGHDTLGRYYLETLAWYFARPRFVWSHAFSGRRAEYWFRRHLDTIGRYLSEAERSHLAKMAELGTAKKNIDAQYAMQALLKRWTLFHVPLATAMLALAAWHAILVHVFAR